MKTIIMSATADDGAGRSYISGNEYTVQDSLAATFYAAGKCSYKSSIGDIAAQIDGLSGNVTGLVGPDGNRALIPFVLKARHTPSSKADSDTTETELYAFTIPANTLGKNDTLKITHLWTYPNSATSKSIKINLGSSTVLSFSVTTTSKHQGVEYGRNRNSQVSQIWNNDQVPYGPRAATTLATAIDTSLDQVLSFRAAWGTAGAGSNLITLESLIVEVIPGA